MQTLREAVVNRFLPELGRVTIARDPDGVLDDEIIVTALRERGFEVVFFGDPIVFRFEFETRHRARWLRGESGELIVVDRAINSFELPYDVVRDAGHEVRLGLAELFPTVSSTVVGELGSVQRERLFAALAETPPPLPHPLGGTRTRDYLLDSVFDARTDSMRTAARLVAFLIRVHAAGWVMPHTVAARLRDRLHVMGSFEDWPLDVLLTSREDLNAFLAERWPVFIDALTVLLSGSAAAIQVRPPLRYRGPTILPFDDNEVRGLIAGLFLDGALNSIGHPAAALAVRAGWGFGVTYDPAEERRERISHLLSVLEQEPPREEDRHQQWLTFASRYAEMQALRWEAAESLDAATQRRVLLLEHAVDLRFQGWLLTRYAALSDQPARPPVMVHHVVRHLAARRRVHKGRSALVLVDGLSMDQWVAIRRELASTDWSRLAGGVAIRDSAVFAWVPTLTSVSRQAAFAGERPMVFSDRINRTDGEEDLWRRFWENEGLEPHEIGYQRSLREPSIEDLENLVGPPALRAVGLVIDRVDRIMHGMELGAAGMHGQVRQWARGGALVRVIETLLLHGYDVCMTSDHGNVEAHGIGSPREGAAAELRGERVRVFRDPGLRRRVHQGLSETVEWPPIGLPDDYLPLVAVGRAAFVKEGETTVAHGGISLDEVIVPWVEFTRTAQAIAA